MRNADTDHPLELALRERLDDWQAWLVYADWLSERGDPRGRLIGLAHQFETAPLGDAMRRKLSREGKIIEAELAGQLPALPDSMRVTWRCGFIIEVASVIDDEALALLGTLFRHPHARLLARLRLHTRLRDNLHDDDSLLEDGDDFPPLSPALIDALLDLDLSRLTTLAIEYTSLDEHGVARVAEHGPLARLRSLDLRFASLTDACAEHLAASPHLRGLEALALPRNRIGPAGARALAAADWPQLRRLDLRENPLEPAGARALAGSPMLERLDSLLLYRDDIGPEGARALAHSPHLPFALRRHWAAMWSAGHAAAS